MWSSVEACPKHSVCCVHPCLMNGLKRMNQKSNEELLYMYHTESWPASSYSVTVFSLSVLGRA